VPLHYEWQREIRAQALVLGPVLVLVLVLVLVPVPVLVLAVPALVPRAGGKELLFQN
jgi:cytochrome c oxidase subunit IV